MHGKSYHIEVNEYVLRRYLDGLHDVQTAMEEMAENRRIRSCHDSFLTISARHLFTEIEGLEEYLSDKSDTEDKA